MIDHGMQVQGRCIRNPISGFMRILAGEAMRHGVGWVETSLGRYVAVAVADNVVRPGTTSGPERVRLDRVGPGDADGDGDGEAAMTLTTPPVTSGMLSSPMVSLAKSP